MLDIFRGIRSLIKISHTHIDSTVFRMHYSITVLFLLLFSLIVSTRQYVGNPIDCMRNREIPEEVINQYCWIHSTYTIPEAYEHHHRPVPHPGVDSSHLIYEHRHHRPVYHRTNSNKKESRRYARYYQWVYLCLFFQVRNFACFFLIYSAKIWVFLINYQC